MFFYCIIPRYNKRMAPRLSLHTTPKRPKKNPLVAAVRKEVFIGLEGALATDTGVLSKAYEKLSKDLKETDLLERLFADVGDGVLIWIPQMLKFPGKKKVEELFFSDARADDPLLEEDEAYGIEDPDAEDHKKDFDEIIAAKEKLRLPKAIVFFWFLAKREGTEKATLLLEMTFATIALYKLMVAKVFPKQKILNSAMFAALPPEFQGVLQGYGTFEEKVTVSKVSEDVATRVSLEMADASDQVIEGLIKQAHSKIDAVTGEETRSSREVQYFALELLKTPTFVRIAETIIKASPLVKN